MGMRKRRVLPLSQQSTGALTGRKLPSPSTTALSAPVRTLAQSCPAAGAMLLLGGAVMVPPMPPGARFIVAFISHIPADSPCDLTALCHSLRKGVGGQALRAVAPCVAGVVVDFHLKAVGTGGDSGDHHGLHKVCLAGGVAGVHDDGQMGLLVDDRHSGEVEGVAGVLLEGADAALTEDD